MTELNLKDSYKTFYPLKEIFNNEIDYRGNDFIIILGILLLGISSSLSSLSRLLSNDITTKKFLIFGTVDLTSNIGKTIYVLFQGAISGSQGYILGGLITWGLLKVAGIKVGKVLDVCSLHIFAMIPMSIIFIVEEVCLLFNPSLKTEDQITLFSGIFLILNLYGLFCYFRGIQIRYNASGLRFYAIVFGLPLTLGITLIAFLGTVGINV